MLFRNILAGLGLLSSLAYAAPRPNIVFIQADDLGPGDLGVTWQNSRAGTQKFATPHLDDFAAEGARLTRHYAPAPVCAPSRSSLQLGVTQGQANVRDNQFDKVLDNNHTLGSVLRTAGYATAAIGKWGLGGGEGSGYPGHPQNRGYDYYFGVLEHGDAHTHYAKDAPTSGTIQIQDGVTDVTQQLDKAYSTDLWAARAKKWIIDQHTADPAKPFFLYLGFTAPHARLQVPTQAYPAGWGVSGGLQWTGVPGAIINTASGTIDSYIHPDYASTSWPAAEKRHATMIRRLDDAVYDLEKTLEDLGIGSNTLIVFTSDNGAHNEAGSGGSYTQDPKFFGSYGPYDGIKRDMWEGGVRMPALVKWPVGVPAGTIDNVASQAHDWLATFAELAGVPKPARSDGQSIVSDLTGTGTRKPSLIYSEYNYDGSTPDYPDFETSHRAAVRDEMQFVQIGDYKGVRTNITNHETDDFLIYNVATDVKETTNLSGQPGVPTQRQFKDRVLQVRRADSGTARSFDAVPIPALATPPQVKHGLAYRTYSGTYPWVPDFETLTAAGEGETTVPDPLVTPADGDSGLLFSGYLRVPADGVYTFHLTTDTGAFVRIHDAQLLDADAGYAPGSEVSTTLPLKAGLHPIRLHYRHNHGAARTLSLKWSSSTLAKQEIAASSFFIEGEPDPSAPLAQADSAIASGSTLTAGIPVSIDVLANDYDADAAPSPLSIASVSQPAHGSVVIESGKVTYTPVKGFFGTDHFGYSVTDGSSESPAIVTVEITQPLSANLWLPLDEGSGTGIHEAGGVRLATLGDVTQWTAGKHGGGLQFDGINQQITIASYAPPLGKVARTLTAWIKVPTAAQVENAAWFSYGPNTNGNRFSARIDNGGNIGHLRLEVQGGFIVGASNLADGLWHFVAIVVSDANNDGTTNVTETKLYVDGVEETISTSSTRAIDTQAGPALTLGGSSHAANYNFAGVLDDVRFEARALTKSEIVSRAQQPAERNAWLYRYTGNTTLTDGDWTNDNDRDGFNPLLEYALGGTPGTLDRIAPQLGVGEDRTYTFNRRRSGLAASAYVVEVSPTLASDSWTAVEDANISVEPHPDLKDFDRVTVHLPEARSGTQFARLRVAP